MGEHKVRPYNSVLCTIPFGRNDDQGPLEPEFWLPDHFQPKSPDNWDDVGKREHITYDNKHIVVI